jgi:hypothetical protein
MTSVPHRIEPVTPETLKAELADLASLCRDRPQQQTDLLGANGFYGHDGIIRAYAGLPSTHWLPCVIPHGAAVWYDDYVWEIEVENPLPQIWCPIPHRQDSYRRIVGDTKTIVPSASPYLYVKELAKPYTPTADRRGTLAFPSHSTHYVTADADYDGLAATLAALPAEFQPVTVCLYWRDFNLGRAEPYLKRGLRVVSAGHIFDPRFLFRLHLLCSQHHYATGNDRGSHIVFSVSSGCSYFSLDSFPNEYAIPNGTRVPTPHDGADRRAQLTGLFAEPRRNSSPDQLDLVDYYLGTQNFWLPREMRDRIIAANHPFERNLAALRIRQVVKRLHQDPRPPTMALGSEKLTKDY